MTRPSLRSEVVLLALLVGCAGSTRTAVSVTPSTSGAEARGTLWVVAPHPDDEILMAGQTLMDAIATGTPYQVVIVTNGDFTCTRNGWARQLESIEALASIGVTEDHVHFLGYPDGWLAELGETPLSPIPRTAADGSCGTGEATYGARGAEHADVHTARTGSPAPLTSTALTEDLVALFEGAPPSEIHLPHPIDDHPDHAMTYAYVRRALEQAVLPRLPMLVRHVVHAGPCWPASEGSACVPPSSALDATPLPSLPPPLEHYHPDRVIPADAARRRAAIGHYVSQLEAPLETSWLASFARTTEPGWTEYLARLDGEPAMPVPGGDVEGARGAMGADYAVGERHAASFGAERELVLERREDRLVLSVRARNHAGEERALREMRVPPLGTTVGLSVHHMPDPADRSATLIEVHGPEGLILAAVLMRAAS